jgi:hypothetical protein
MSIRQKISMITPVVLVSQQLLIKTGIKLLISVISVLRRMTVTVILVTRVLIIHLMIVPLLIVLTPLSVRIIMMDVTAVLANQMVKLFVR